VRTRHRPSPHRRRGERRPDPGPRPRGRRAPPRPARRARRGPRERAVTAPPVDRRAQRLSPLSPIRHVRRAGPALAIGGLAALTPGASLWGVGIPAAVLGVAALYGVFTWATTRWRLNGDVLELERGLVRRTSPRYPLSQVQAIDVLQPAVARMLG